MNPSPCNAHRQGRSPRHYRPCPSDTRQRLGNSARRKHAVRQFTHEDAASRQSSIASKNPLPGLATNWRSRRACLQVACSTPHTLASASGLACAHHVEIGRSMASHGRSKRPRPSAAGVQASGIERAITPVGSKPWQTPAAAATLRRPRPSALATSSKAAAQVAASSVSRSGGTDQGDRPRRRQYSTVVRFALQGGHPSKGWRRSHILHY